MIIYFYLQSEMATKEKFKDDSQLIATSGKQECPMEHYLWQDIGVSASVEPLEIRIMFSSVSTGRICYCINYV